MCQIVGLLVVDDKDQLFFKMPECCVSNEMNHHWFLNGISEEHVVIYGKTAAQSIENSPPHKSAIIEINKSVVRTRKKYPYRPILLVGNRKVLRNYNHLDKMIVIKYNKPGATIDTIDPAVDSKFREPKNVRKRIVTHNPKYSIIEYDLNPVEINTIDTQVLGGQTIE